ncbi:hypothetical protein LFT51_29150 (plasmid) [Mycobacterium intracellulare subsp. chimaera]|uniref:PPW family C-terminal domain-containing PPE protein n=1 Tax=Mycobacterium intracellulare TaxID=1767 RepID=UPI001CF3DD8A|nr:hypothetical protein LFT51_29150 [Mycobacterium intracellulare subsp. chimaera]
MSVKNVIRSYSAISSGQLLNLASSASDRNRTGIRHAIRDHQCRTRKPPVGVRSGIDPDWGGDPDEQPVPTASCLASLAGNEFGGGPSVPMVPATWDGDQGNRS